MKKTFLIFSLLASAFLMAGQKNTIVDVAVNAGTFDTLVTAVKEAGLAETLTSSGPFTVFAPTDEAFSKLPEGTLEQLLKDKEALKSILLYHVVPGTLQAKDVLAKTNLTSAEGSLIQVSTQDEARVNGTKILKTDIKADNGIIHVIDEVILPPKKASKSKSSCTSSCTADKTTTT